MSRLSECIQVDDELEVVTIYGLRIHADLFRVLARPSPPGVWFRIIAVDDGVATVQEMPEDVIRARK